MKHTKGPWVIQHEFDSDPTYILAQGDVDIATLPEYIEAEERFANAHLIAAAPELLEACKSVLYFKNNISPRVQKLINAAIDKAEGKN